MCGYCGCEQLDTKVHDHHDPRIIQIEQDILTENQRHADQNRKFLKKKNILTFNLVSSPGSGKTTLLIEIIHALKNTLPLSVIEGDQQTDLDMQRIAATGVPVLQINTGKSCHLDAHRIGHSLEELPLVENSILFIENVGNLVCPALFDLGENCKIVILSVTEGDDKPLKYPHMFDQAQLLVINKMDLLPYVNFDIDQCVKYAKQINPHIEILKTSAETGDGITEFSTWLTKNNNNV